MKKTLALVLALAMVFSTITVAFAEDTLGADAQTCANLGMLKGPAGTVDAAYVATAPTRMQAAVMFLRLKGLEAEALAFTGEDNFVDGELAWAEGANLLAYLKANPQYGWIGDGTNFNPDALVTPQMYYKVLLEALGYKQTTTDVEGDFTWEGVLAFAAEKGLTAVAAVENFTVNDLAIATVEALKLTVNGTTTTLVESLVASGKIDEAAAVAAGLVTAELAVAVKEAKAVGNSVVEVTFEAAIDDAAGDVDNYAIEGLEISAAVVSGAKTVRLTTAAQAVGKVYNLTVGEKTVKFAGIAKVSGGPLLTDAVGEDVEEVVLTFDVFVDYATASDVANYTIAGVEIVSAAVDDKEVTLTTEGLKDDTDYKVKAANIKSIDGVLRKTTSFDFETDYDTASPRLDGVVQETNQRIILWFDEEVTEESAEDLANYAIYDEDDVALEIISVVWNTDPEDTEDNVEITTEAQVKNEEYTLKVSNIADQRKVANVMKRTLSEKFDGEDEDTDEPEVDPVQIIAKDKFILTFTDDSKLDEESILSENSYTLTDEDDNYMDVDEVETLLNINGKLQVLVTVEELTAGENYDLEVVDILDEFGNALESDIVDVDPVVADFAAANVTDIEFSKTDDEEVTEVVVTFDMQLREATAENIGAYSFDNEGGAPTKATYDYDDVLDVVTVTLLFNELVNGEEYELTVDGVEDMAGNILKFETDDYQAVAVLVADDWDDDEPELKGADALNMYVAALEFGEEVTFAAGTTLFLAPDGDEDNLVELEAKTTSDDDTVVEFSSFVGGAWVELDPDVTYSVYKIENGGAFGGITDLYGNEFLEIEDYDDMEEFKGDASDPDYPEVEDIEQVNGGTFEVTMSGNVAFRTDILIADTDADGSIDDETYTATDADGIDFEVTLDDNVVTFVIEDAEDGIDKDETYTFELNDFLTDLHGNIVVDEDEDTDTTVCEGESADTKLPVVEDVRALDRWTVEIEFSEDIKYADELDFAIFNVDLDDDPVGIDNGSIDIDGNLVTLTLDDPLEGRYEYNLQMDGGVVEDFAGNEAEEDEDLYFDGSDASDY